MLRCTLKNNCYIFTKAGMIIRHLFLKHLNYSLQEMDLLKKLFILKLHVDVTILNWRQFSLNIVC